MYHSPQNFLFHITPSNVDQSKQHYILQKCCHEGTFVAEHYNRGLLYITLFKLFTIFFNNKSPNTTVFGTNLIILLAFFNFKAIFKISNLISKITTFFRHTTFASTSKFNIVCFGFLQANFRFLFASCTPLFLTLYIHYNTKMSYCQPFLRLFCVNLLHFYAP